MMSDDVIIFSTCTCQVSRVHNKWQQYKYSSYCMMLLFSRLIESLLFLLYQLISQCLVKDKDKFKQSVERRKLQLMAERQNRQKYILPYDPMSCGSLNRFQTCQEASPCIFAKTAKLWGSPEYERDKTLQENISCLMPALLKFISLIESPNFKFDGFVIEIKGKQYSSDLAAFSKTVRIVLQTISELDPSGLNTMSMRVLSSQWHFSLCTIPIFVTTFAPFYGPDHARYMGKNTNDNRDSSFLLLQPEEAFHRHRIGLDTPQTSWQDPQTVRDKIRVSFREKGRSYYIPPEVSYPVAEHFVPHPENIKADELKQPLVHFWDI